MRHTEREQPNLQSSTTGVERTGEAAGARPTEACTPQQAFARDPTASGGPLGAASRGSLPHSIQVLFGVSLDPFKPPLSITERLLQREDSPCR